MKKMVLGVASVLAGVSSLACVADAPLKVELVAGGVAALFLLAGQSLLSTGLEQMFDASPSDVPKIPSSLIAPGGPGGTV